MVQQNELVTMLIGLGVVLYILINHGRFSRIPSFEILRISFFILFTGWVLTITEGFLLGPLMNLVEYICYAASSVLVAVWCWRVFTGDRGAE